MKQKPIISALLLSGSLAAQAVELHPSHHVPVDKNLSPAFINSLTDPTHKVYSGDELYTIGMPVGGICAGQLYVRGDGTLANWWIANNAYNTGYGIDHLKNFDTKLGPWQVCYQTFKPTSYIDQGFAIEVTDKQGNVQQRELSEKDFDAIEFVGEYPIATVHYKDSESFPVAVSSQVFSPFIPLNAKDSGMPLTILKYTVENTSKKAVSVSLGGWLQNLVCQELKDDVTALSRNTVVEREDGISVVFDLIRDPSLKAADTQSIADFASYEGWVVAGTAFGDKPVAGALGRQGPVSKNDGTFVNSFHGDDRATGKMTSEPFSISKDFISFRIGGGHHPQKTSLNLLVDGKIVRTATGQNSETLNTDSWDVSEFKGQQGILEIVDSVSGSWGHVLVDEIQLSSVAPPKPFPAEHPYFGNVSLTLLGEGKASAELKGDASATIGSKFHASEQATVDLGKVLNGGLQSDFKLRAGESKTLTFALSWYFPNRRTAPGRSTGDWNRAIPTEGGELVGQMYDNWFDHSQDVVSYFSGNRERLESETHNFHQTYYTDSSLPYWLNNRLMMPLSILATETCQWWKNGRFWAFEGVGSCHGTCTHVWNYAHGLARFFPELERTVREEQDLGVAFNPNDGSVKMRGVNGHIAFDGQGGTVLKSYREHLLSKDNSFLERNWSKIKKATQFLINEDKKDGELNGLIAGKQHNTYDINFHGSNTYVGSLYLGALKAAEQMALIMGDDAFARECAQLANLGAKSSVDQLWNGSYFIQDVDREKYPRSQYADGCLSDQMFGQTWAHQLQLGYLYPEDKVKTTLESIWNYNWAPDVATQNKVHIPERTYADHGEAGLFIATWPFSKHHGNDGVRYRNEVWTGIEYQVATNMINEGMITEGLSMIRAIEDRYDGTTNNPWNEIECGDHYARAKASWGAMVALQDYAYNGPAKELGFAPKIQEDDFRSFFLGAEGWGNLSQQQKRGKQVNTVEVDYGTVELKTLSVSAMPNKKASLRVNGKKVKASGEVVDGKLIVTLDSVLLLEAGDKLEIKQG